MQTVVLDTNVIISAVVFGGNPRKVFELILEGRLSLVISFEILQEIGEVLGGKKFQYPEPVLHILMTELESLAKLVQPELKIKKITKDPDDNKFLECAVSGGADFIISGDIHLLELGSFQDIPNVSPSEFLEKHG